MTNLLYSGDDEYTYFGPTETAPLLGLEGKVYDCHATQTQRIAELEAENATLRKQLLEIGVVTREIGNLYVNMTGSSTVRTVLAQLDYLISQVQP